MKIQKDLPICFKSFNFLKIIGENLLVEKVDDHTSKKNELIMSSHLSTSKYKVGRVLMVGEGDHKISFKKSDLVLYREVTHESIEHGKNLIILCFKDVIGILGENNE